MSNRPVSIQDIARTAGVSHSTVSRALHDSPLISPMVRARIQQLALEMGYSPNAVAQSLKGQRTNTVGLVVTSIADPFVGRVVRGIEDVAAQQCGGRTAAVPQRPWVSHICRPRISGFAPVPNGRVFVRRSRFRVRRKAQGAIRIGDPGYVDHPRRTEAAP